MLTSNRWKTYRLGESHFEHGKYIYATLSMICMLRRIVNPRRTLQELLGIINQSRFPILHLHLCFPNFEPSQLPSVTLLLNGVEKTTCQLGLHLVDHHPCVLEFCRRSDSTSLSESLRIFGNHIRASELLGRSSCGAILNSTSKRSSS